MILSYEVGDRSGSTAIEFMDDLRSRLANRVQLTTEAMSLSLLKFVGQASLVDDAMLPS